MTFKKSLEELIGIIAVILFFTIMLIGIIAWANSSQDAAQDASCTLQVQKAHQLSKITDKPAAHAQCERKDLEELKLSSNSQQAKNELTLFLRDEFDSCFTKFGRGKLNPFPGELWKQKTHCYVCRPFVVEKGPKSLVMDQNLRQSIDSFSSYDLSKAFLREKVGSDEIIRFYTEAINHDNLWESLEKDLSKSFVVEKGEEYYIVQGFVGDKDISILSTITLGALGVSIGETEMVPYLYVTKKSTFPDTCTVPEN